MGVRLSLLRAHGGLNMDHQVPDSTSETRAQPCDPRSLQLRIAQLEADVAYFDARMELLGLPTTCNQLGQYRTYKLLYFYLGRRVRAARQRLRDGAHPPADPVGARVKDAGG